MRRFRCPVLLALLWLLGTTHAYGQSGRELHAHLSGRYEEMHRALASKDVLGAADILAPGYTEARDNEPLLTRAERVSAWQRWLENHVSVGPAYVTIEELEHSTRDTAVARVRITTASSVREPGNGIQPKVIDEVRRDTWVFGAKGWTLHRSEPLSGARPGEFIPAADEPESPRLRQLVERMRGEGLDALAAFWREIADHAPLVEPIVGDGAHYLVTFVARGHPNIERIGLYGELPYPPWNDRRLARLPGTDLWYYSMRVPADTRTTYGLDFFWNGARAGAGQSENQGKPFIVSIPDPRNPWQFHEASVLELPGASPQPYVAERPNVPKGRLVRDTLFSHALAEDRIISVYTPSGFASAEGPHPMVVLFDGPVYGSGRDPLVPTPTILDNLIAEGRIPPVIAVLVHQKERERELAGSEPFTRFLAEELMPWVQGRYRGTSDPTRVVVGGSSLGGLAATYAALERPDVFGNVLSQSGAFWLPRDPRDPARREFVPREIWIAEEFLERPRAPVRFWMEVSRFESATKMLGPNRQLRDLLRAKGYDVVYGEFHGGHDYLHWRGSLADGLIDLLGS